MSDLKPGDRALVVRCFFREFVGRVGVVTAITHDEIKKCVYTGRDMAGVSVYLDLLPGACWRPESLIRIPPDDEARRLFRETEKPVAA